MVYDGGMDSAAPCFDAIESRETDVHLGICSGYKQFVRSVRSIDAVAMLRRAVREDPSLRLHIIERIQSIRDEKIDLEYGHPHDTAAAIYGDILLVCRDEMLWKDVARVYKLIAEIPNGFWCYRSATALATTD